MATRHGLTGLVLAFALDGGVQSFTSFPPCSTPGVASVTSACSTRFSTTLSGEGTPNVGRREFIASAEASIGLALVSAWTLPRAAEATVNFEIDRYGDKELKIATVNKLRQQIRNALLEEPSLASDMVKLAIADALGFDVATQSGGPDGSVLLEMERDATKGLKPALNAALKIKKNLQRTNEMTLADVVAMGGAEAIHAVGGPPILVQLGRYDEKRQANPAPDIPGFNFEAPTAAGLKAAFKRAGLGPREMVLLLGAMGSVSEATSALGDKGEEEQDDLEDLAWQNTIPNTFGKESDKLGRPLATGFGPGFLQRVAAGKPGGVVGSALLGDEEVKSFVRKYAGNSRAFVEDLSEAYTKMTKLGERYESRNAS